MGDMPAMVDRLKEMLGLDVRPGDLTFGQMAARAVVVFAFGVILVRLADRRFLGRNAGFDVLLGIMLGSILSRAVNGQAAFFPTLGVSAFIVLLHRLLGTAACRSHTLSLLLKGEPKLLVRNGTADRAAMDAAKISSDDLEENLRVNGNVSRVGDVAEARLERDGVISVVQRKDPGGPS
jgi:uncharacterized membrane protein YcaP (DUF421 family)